MAKGLIDLPSRKAARECAMEAFTSPFIADLLLPDWHIAPVVAG
jgi:hypothetical protein